MTDEFVPLLKFTPSAQDPEILERITVQREELIASLVESALDTGGGRTHHLLIGPRGMGKTHILTLVANRIRESKQSDDVLLAWLDEDPWSIRSYEKLLAAITTSLAKETEDPALAQRAAALRPRGAADGIAGEELLRNIVGERILVLLIENLDEVFHRIGPNGQARLRALLEDWRQATIVATAAQLFEGIQRHASPFYGFFAVTHLEELSLESATELMRRVAELRDNADLLRFLDTEAAKRRLRAIEAMAGGHPRVWLLLAGCVSVEAIDELVPLFLEALDDLTPYYQSRLKELGEQQQELVVLLGEDGGALSNRTLSERSGIPQNQVASILRQLMRSNYVRHAEVPADLAGGDKRMTYWELREPLMRLCLDVKQSHGKPLRMVVEFLRAWYGSNLLDELARLPDSANLAATYAQEAFRGLEGKLSAAELLRGSPGEILTRTEIGLALIPEDPSLHIAKAQALLQEDHYAAAQDFLEPLVPENSSDELSPEGFILGCQLIMAKVQLDPTKARSLSQAFVTFTERAPAVPPAMAATVHVALGSTLGELGRYEEALETFETAIGLDPKNASAHTGRGMACGELGRVGESLEEFERAIELDPENAFAHLRRGEVLADLSHTEEALEAFERAIELDPEDDLAHIERGAALSTLGRPEEALEAFERAIELDPENAFAHLRRGNGLDDLGRYEEALEALERAIELDPENAFACASYGIVVGKLGRTEEALEAFEQATELDRVAPQYPFAATGILLFQRNSEKALERLREVLRRTKNNASLASTFLDGLCQIILVSFEGDPERADLIARVVDTHAEASATDHLGNSLIGSIPFLMEEDVSQGAAESWTEEWEAAAGGHAELEIPLEILRAAVAWKDDRDKAHLLALPPEQREILMQLLQPT